MDQSFPSTAHMPFELPPTFSIIFENIDDISEKFYIIYGLFHVQAELWRWWLIQYLLTAVLIVHDDRYTHE